jgi:TolA protein
MAGGTPARQTLTSPEARDASRTAEEGLPKWIIVSIAAHGVLIAVLLWASLWPSKRPQPPPSYVVDLVGGERIGGRSLGTKVIVESKTKAGKAEAEAPPKSKPAAAPEPLDKAPVKLEKPSKREKIEREKAEKIKAKEVTEPAPDKQKVKVQPEEKTAVAAKSAPKETAAKETKESAASRETTTADEDSLEKVRERVMQAAIERARSRAASSAGANASTAGSRDTKPDKGEPLSAGSGEGIGAQSLGKGGIGGEGILKSVEFIAYQNRLVNTIKANWAWAGRRSDLKVVVQFGIKENGEIVGLRVTQRSGDPTYDESVIRAIKRSNPFVPPPEAHRKEFADVEMTFRPSDFGA